MKVKIFVACFVLVNASCATTPMVVTNATQASQDRLLAFQIPLAGPSGTLIVTRDKGFLGGGCYYSFYINDTLAARLGVGETSRFHISPGELVLRAGRDPQGKALCGMGQQDWTQRETILRVNETKYFRLSIDANGKTDIQRADPVQ